MAQIGIWRRFKGTNKNLVSMIADLLNILNSYSIALHGKPLAYIQNRGFYLVEGYQDQSTGEIRYMLTSLDGTTTLFDVPKGQKVYHLDSEKSITQLVRDGVAAGSLLGRSAAAMQSQGYRFTVGNLDLSQEQERIAEKYGIEDLSQMYENVFLKQILREIRKLTIEAIERATRNKKGKREILLVWEQVKEQAEQNNFVELEDLRDRLLRLAGKQKRGENASLIREAKREIREELWGKVVRTLKIWTTVVVFFTAVAVAIAVNVKSSDRRTMGQSLAKSENVLTRKDTLTLERIERAIDRHNRTTRDEIYPWREEKIKAYLLKNFASLSDERLGEMIDTLATTKYPFWKE